MKILFVIVLLSVVTGSLSQNTSCSPAQDCSSGSALDQVPDPESCSRYYVCVLVDGVVVPSDAYFTCPDGEYFEPSEGSCIDLEGPTCYNTCSNHCSMVCNSQTPTERVAFPGKTDRYNGCVGGTAVETMCPSLNPYFDGHNCVQDASAICDFCSPHCEEAGIQIADPTDCRKYYICGGEGNPDWDHHGDCNDGMYFDATSGMCVVGVECVAICVESN